MAVRVRRRRRRRTPCRQTATPARSRSTALPARSSSPRASPGSFRPSPAGAACPFRGIPASRRRHGARPLDPTRRATSHEDAATPPPEGTGLSATPLHQDPSSARVGTVRALFRLREYAGPALPFIVAGMVAALIAQLIALAIPQVLQAIVDGPLADGDASAIWPLAGLVLGLGVLEAGMIALRRWFVLTPGTHVEARMRNALYAQAAGPARDASTTAGRAGSCSRARCSDLSLIRRWLAFGLVLLVVNLITIVVGFGILVSDELDARARLPRLLDPALDRRLPVRGAATPRSSRRSQDQAGDLATAVEESVHGIRVLKAFGRGKHALHEVPRAGRDAAQHRDREGAARSPASGSGCSLVPDVAFAAVPRARRLARRRRAQLTVGELVAFFATATVLRWPIESIGFLLVVHARRAHRDRPVLRGPRRARTTITDPERPVTIDAPDAASSSFERRALPLPGLARPRSATCSTASTSCSSRARPWRSSASPARARRR